MRRVAATVWAGALLGLGAVALSAAWDGSAAIVVLAPAALAPLPLVAAGARWRVPAPITALAILGLAAALAYSLVLNPEGLDVETAVRDSVPRLLTARRPAPASPALLLPGAALALLVGLWVALRMAAPPLQRRALVAAPVGALVLYTAGTLLTAGTGDPYGLVAGGIVAVSIAGWATVGTGRTGNAAPTTGPTRRAAHRVADSAGRAAVAVSVGVTALAVTAITTPVGSFEPRHLIDPPQRTLSHPSPLPLLAAWHEQGDTELFRVRSVARLGADGPGRPLRVRLVTLSAFTGVAWSASAAYRPVGVVGEATLPPGRHRSTHEAEITVSGLGGMWLPSLGSPVEVTAAGSADLSGVEFEADGGSLVLAGTQLRPGLRYRVRAEVDSATAEQVTAAGVPLAPAAGALLDVPRLPWSFAEYARQATFGASTPFEQAVALEYAVREERRYDPAAPVGSNYARLQTFLFEQDESKAGAQVGSSEQFAAAFAVLARSRGLPSRVVLGFRVGADGVVRGADAIAWPEVYFVGYGWYPFDPTPDTADVSAEPVKLRALDRIGEQAARATTVPSVSPSPVRASPAATPMSAPPVASTPGVSAPSAVTGMATAAVLLALLVLGGMRGTRRLWHRRAGVRGAWSEVLDLLVLLGRPAPRSRAAPDLADDLATLAPIPADDPHPAVRLAVAAERAAFGPPAGSRVDASSAWAALRKLRRAVRATVPLRRRLLWPIDPRPLRRRR